MRILGAGWLLPICICASACLADPPEEIGDRENVSSTTLAAAAAKPEDAPAALAAAPGKPSFSIKAPALRKATRDEVEELNETFRTEGSRDRVLRRIELASAEDRQRIVAYYNSVVTKNLEGEDNQRAKAKLATTLARAAAK